jgi:hypothetical protein
MSLIGGFRYRRVSGHLVLTLFMVGVLGTSSVLVTDDVFGFILRPSRCLPETGRCYRSAFVSNACPQIVVTVRLRGRP